MKKLLALALAMIMMVFALAACGEDTGKTPSDGTDNPGTSQQGNDNSDGLFDIADSDIDVGSEYDISMVPSVIKKGIGTLKLFRVSTPRPADLYKTSINYGFKLESSEVDNAKTTLLNYYTSNGGSAEANGSIETIVTFDWGNIVVSVYTTGSIDCVANVNKQ